jgi:hypothetical protein
MKKLILFALVSLLIIPALAKAQILCDTYTYPFRQCEIVKEFTDVIAGNPTSTEFSFVYKGLSWTPVVIRLNITSQDYSFTGQEFTAYGELKTKALQGPAESSFDLICKQPNVTFNQTGDTFEKPENMITFYCYNDTFYIAMPLSQNNVTLTVVPHIAIQPAKFNFTLELLSEVGIIVIEPEVKVENGYGKMEIGYPYNEYLEFYLPNQNVTIRVTAYSELFIKQVPKERPFGIAYFDFKNEKAFNGSIEIRYYFDPTTIISRGYDLNNLRFYKFEGNIWKLVPSSGVVIINDTLAYVYVYVNLTSFSLYGIFTSFYYPPSQIVYTGGGTTYYITNVTNVTNITQVVENPIVRETVKEVPTKAVCGNGICEVGESCSLCPEDCKCASGYECIEGTCLPKPICGNGICERGEDSTNCPEDCAKPTGITGRIISTITNPIIAAGFILAIITVLAVLKIRRNMKK